MARQNKNQSAPLPSPIYIQHVTIWWTKASRGMPGAKVRAQLPQTFSLTPAEINALGAGGIHLVTMWEGENFMPKMELRPLPTKEIMPIGALRVQRNEPGVHIDYRRSRMHARIPSRRPITRFDVAAGRRARIAYNARFSGYSIEWLYKLSVITVAVGIPPSADLFTVAPDHSVEDLADLF